MGLLSSLLDMNKLDYDLSLDTLQKHRKHLRKG